jgi:hypothetical protein
MKRMKTTYIKVMQRDLDFHSFLAIDKYEVESLQRKRLVPQLMVT